MSRHATHARGGQERDHYGDYLIYEPERKAHEAGLPWDPSMVGREAVGATPAAAE
jgi:hypothetical protein